MAEYTLTVPTRLEGRLGGAAGGGRVTSQLAVGGLDTQTETVYSYNNYVIAYATPSIPANCVITKVNLVIGTAENDLAAFKTWVSMLLINNDNDTEMFLTPNTIQYKTLNSSWIIPNKENVIIFSAVAQASRQFINYIYLDITYSDDIIVEPVPVDLRKPIQPSIISMQADMNNNYCDKQFVITVDYAHNTNYVFEIAYGSSTELESNVIKTIKTPLNRITVYVPSVIPQGKNVYVRVKGINSYGSSLWSAWNNSVIKNYKPTISDISVSSEIISKILTNSFLVDSKLVILSANVYDRGGTFSTTNIAKLQQLTDGVWTDIPNANIGIGTSGIVNFSILPTGSENEGGISIEQKSKEYRIVYTDNRQSVISNIVTLHRNEPPTVTSSSSTETVLVPYGGSISVYPVIKDVNNNLSHVSMTVFEKQQDTQDFISRKVVVTSIEGNNFNGVIAISTSDLRGGSEVKLNIVATDTLGASSSIYAYPTTFKINVPLPKPSLKLDYYYNTSNLTDSMNFVFNDTVKIVWQALSRPYDSKPISYNLYKDSTSTIFKTFAQDKLSFEFDLSYLQEGSAVRFWMQASDGLNVSELEGPLTVYKNTKPSINSSMTVYSGSDYMKTGTLTNLTITNNIPEILYVRVPYGQSISTKQSDLTYRLYVYNETQNTLTSQSITNLVKDSSQVSFFVWLSTLGVIPGDRIKLFVNAVDRFGVESSTITLL